MGRLAAFTPFILLTACAGVGDDDDSTPPTLEVTAPERGTMIEADTITVTGTVSDDSGWVEVHVNGALATVEGGTFTATIELTPGVEAIETIARDRTGNEERDVRAAMSGALQPVDSTVADAVGARIGGDAMGVIGDTVARYVEGLDLTAIARQYNPVASDPGSCLGYEVFIDTVYVDGVSLDLAPTLGAIHLGASVTHLDVYGHADYTFSCFDGTEDFRVTVDVVDAAGGLGLAVDGYEVYSWLDGVQIGLQNFQLTTENMPGVIEDYVSDRMEEELPGILAGMLGEVVPPQVDGLLADMTSKAYSVPVLGHDIAIQAHPSAVSIDEAGATVVFDGSLVVAGGEGAMFVSTPAPVTSSIMGEGGGMSFAVADDTINQLFAGLWATGAMDVDMPLEAGNPLQLLFGADTRSLKMELMLPPTASTGFDGALHLVVGDMIVTTADENGEEMARFALTLSTSLVASLPEGRIKLNIGDTRAWADILEQSDRIDPPMNERDLEGLVMALADVAGGSINTALESVTLPTVAGLSLVEPGIEARDGFVIVSAGVAAQ